MLSYNYFYYMKKFLILILLLPLFAMGQAPTNDSTKLVAPPIVGSFTMSSLYYRGGNTSNGQVGYLNTITGKWAQLITGYQFNHYTGTSTQTLLNLKLNISDTAAMLSSYQHKVTNGFILDNLTNTPQSARISLSDSIKTTGVVKSLKIETDSINFNYISNHGDASYVKMKMSVINPATVSLWNSNLAVPLSSSIYYESVNFRHGGGALAVSNQYTDSPGWITQDKDYTGHSTTGYYFAGNNGFGYLGYTSLTGSAWPISGVPAIRYSQTGDVDIPLSTSTFTTYGHAAYNGGKTLNSLDFLYKQKADSLYAPISGSPSYVPYTGATGDINIGTHNLTLNGTLAAVATNTNSLDVSSNSFVWDNPSILTQFANSQTSYSGVYNSFVTYGYNQFGAGNATLKVVPSQYVLQSFARDTSFSNRYQALLVSGTNIKTVNSNSLIGSGNVAVGDALVANPLSQFASTTSAQLRSVLSDETGNGLDYFQNGDLGTPSAGVGTNLTGTAAGLTAGLATALQTARAINGVNFDGTTPITITAAPTAGSTNYIQNGTSQQTSANYNIDGNGTIGGNLRVTGLTGMGAASSAGIRLLLSGTAPNSGTASTGILINHTIPSSSTGSVAAYQSNLVTQAASFTLATFRHFYAIDVTIGSGSTVTNQYGFYATSLTGGTNNYGFYSDLSASANRWNFYANGTAVNYFNGNLQLGSSTATAGAEKLQVTGPASISSTLLLGGNLTITPFSTAGLVANNSSGLLSSTTALPSGTTATTQSAGDNSTKVATTAYVDAANFPKTVASPRVTAQTTLSSVGNIWTVGASDGSFTISANVLVTASTVHSFGATCTYTDESNTSRTLTLNFSQLTGTFITAITNGTGASAYEGVPVHIRAKAGTQISVATAGTFTSVTYNAEWILQQVN